MRNKEKNDEEKRLLEQIKNLDQQIKKEERKQSQLKKILEPDD